MAITREAILTAADAIDAAGQNPTLAAVRKAVGGGSYTTIQEVMTEWRAKKAAKENPVREPLPAGLTDRAGELASEIWMTALDLAGARLDADRQALAQERIQIDQARLEAVQLADTLMSELDDERARNAGLENDLEHANANAQALRERLAVAEAQNAEITRSLIAEKDAAELARQAMASAREDAAALRGQVEALSEQQRVFIEKLGAGKAK